MYSDLIFCIFLTSCFNVLELLHSFIKPGIHDRSIRETSQNPRTSKEAGIIALLTTSRYILDLNWKGLYILIYKLPMQR